MHKTKLGFAAAVAAAIALPSAGAGMVQAKPTATALHPEPLRSGPDLLQRSAADAWTTGTAHLIKVQHGGGGGGHHR